mgnify:FL=1
MDYKTIFNGDLQDWVLITKQTNTPERIAIAKSAISAGYRLFKRGGKIYHCFESGGGVGCIPTGAKAGDDLSIKKSNIFTIDPNRNLGVEFALKHHCFDALGKFKDFVMVNGKWYFTARFDTWSGIYPMRSTDRYYNEEILISLCIER